MSRRQVLGVAAAAMTGVLPAGARAQRPARRIGFVDDSLDNFHARVYLQIIRETLKDRGFSVVGGTALQEQKSRAWAKQHGLPYFDTVEKLNEVADCFAILAPGTPGTHWELSRRVLPLGKTTFVDKPFAPDRATGAKIFALADRHKVAVQTSSALRYTEVQKYVARVGRRQVRHVVAWGGGGSYDEYAIHPVELTVSCLGHEVVGLMRRGAEPESQLLLNFSGGRTAVVNVYTRADTPFAASVTTAKGTRHFVVDAGRLFVDAAAALLDFFAAGKEQVDRRETLAVLRVLDASRDPAARERFVKV